MNTRNPGLALLEKKVDEFDLRREVEDELAQILIEHKIANLRKSRGLTQAALAQRSGVSQPMIAQIESGKLNNLTLKTLARTARALGASHKRSVDGRIWCASVCFRSSRVIFVGQRAERRATRRVAAADHRANANSSARAAGRGLRQSH